MDEVYLPGWEGARLAVYRVSAYEPIACITGRSEGNETQTSEKTNVCTEGKTITWPTGVKRNVSIQGEVVEENSLDDLRELQDSLKEQVFRVYRGKGVSNPIYFKGTITSLSADYPTGQGEAATFSMDIAVNGDYLTTDPKA